MAAQGNVLVVDDDPEIRGMLAEYLSGHGYHVAEAADGDAMRAELARQVPDVVLLDLNLRGENGLALARHLRERHTLGIIMVTGASDVVDRIVGLEMGADDYIAKPFDPRELVARVRSVMRRTQGGGASPAVASAAARQVPIGVCALDIVGHRLFAADGSELPVTSMEFDLLRVFVEHPNRVLSRDSLMDLIKGYERTPFDRSIDVRVTRLRRKIEDDPAAPVYIRTVWGEGYLFAPQGKTA